jgi:hypothetical protein
MGGELEKWRFCCGFVGCGGQNEYLQLLETVCYDGRVKHTKAYSATGGSHEKGYGAFVSAGAAVVFAVSGGGGA